MLSSDRVTTIFQLLAGEDQTLKDQSTNWIIFLALERQNTQPDAYASLLRKGHHACDRAFRHLRVNPPS